MNNPRVLLESIRCEDGSFPLLQLHQHRVNEAFRILWPEAPVPDLYEHIQRFSIPQKGLFKCRILYGASLLEPEYQPYTINPPRKLQLARADDLDYSLKWADRRQLNFLFSEKGACDDVLIIRRGLITDTTYCNIAFLRNGIWFTPAEPLLQGVRRKQLIDNNIILPAAITPDQIFKFTHFKTFNAMIGWVDSPPLPISEIRFTNLESLNL